MRAVGMQLRGIVGTLRLGRVPARALAIADSRSLVRSLFLASAARIDVLAFLRGGRPFSEILQHLGCTRPERLRAWLSIGVELGELSLRRERYGVRGYRSRAIADGDRLLGAHYRSMLEYQIGPYGELENLLHSNTDEGRTDLERYAEDIAQVSLAAAPFVTSFVRRAVAELSPTNVFDVGCGTGVYSTVVLEADSRVHVEGIDLAENVIAVARSEFRRSGLDDRIELHVGDVRQWARESQTHFDLLMLLNNIYYFDQKTRARLYSEMGDLLTDRGQLLIVSMVATGSIAAAHLHFMLTCQDTAASLPTHGEIENDLIEAGFRILTIQTLVPTEPFIGVRAVRG